MQGHDLSGIERFHPKTRHMITLEVQKQCFVGFKGERFRFFLSDEGYQNAKRCEQEREIKIKSHAAVVAGKLSFPCAGSASYPFVDLPPENL